MNKQKYLDMAKKNGWVGIDASLEVSLFEYGLLWIYRPKLHDFLCIIGTRFDDKSQGFDEFATEWYDKSAFNDFVDEINDIGFRSSMDIQPNEWDDKEIDDIPFMIYELISYFGRENFTDNYSRYTTEQILAYISQSKWES